MYERRGLISRQDPKLRNKLLLLALRKSGDGFMPEDKDSGSFRVGLMPQLCFKDGLRDVLLFPVFPVSVLPSHTLFSRRVTWTAVYYLPFASLFERFDQCHWYLLLFAPEQ